jgi:phenylpyruvate tautomerase PptA (4-oxalocrotonate tautomerase family)
MPLYFCNSVPGVIPNKAKPKIAADITDLHSQLMGSTPSSVHVFFFEDAPTQPIAGKSVFLFGSLLAGQPEDLCQHLLTRIKASILTHTGAGLDTIVSDMMEIPKGWVMEGGQVHTDLR